MYLLKKIEHQGKVLRRFFQSEESYLLNTYRKKHCNADVLRQPESLNEKIIHRMLVTREPLHTQLADKVRARDYVADKVGKDYLIPLLGVWRSVAEIDYSVLPEKFVLKCNHDSGSCQIVNNKTPEAIARCNEKLQFSLSRNYYYVSLEWHYKNITPLIIAEEFIDVLVGADRNITPELYRVHCFAGKSHVVEADFTDSEGCSLTNVYDRQWRLQPFTMSNPGNPREVSRPEKFDELMAVAEKLAAGIDYCRVDFFMNRERIWFSEITFTPERGKIKISPRIWDYRLGELWQIPQQ